MKKIPRIYILDKIVTASTVAVDKIQIDKTSNFFITEISFTCTSTSLKIMVRDSVNNKNWFDQRVLLKNLVNNANSGLYTYYLPEPLLMEGNATIHLELEDTSASTNTVQIAVKGYEEAGATK